jgi:hypothetical protein
MYVYSTTLNPGRQVTISKVTNSHALTHDLCIRLILPNAKVSPWETHFAFARRISKNASWGSSTEPTRFIRFFDSFWFSRCFIFRS